MLELLCQVVQGTVTQCNKSLPFLVTLLMLPEACSFHKVLLVDIAPMCTALLAHMIRQLSFMTAACSQLLLIGLTAVEAHQCIPQLCHSSC